MPLLRLLPDRLFRSLRRTPAQHGFYRSAPGAIRFLRRKHHRHGGLAALVQAPRQRCARPHEVLLPCKPCARLALSLAHGARRPRGNASAPPHVHMPPVRRFFDRHGIHAMGRFHGTRRLMPQPIRPCSGLLHRRAALPLLHRAASQARPRNRLLAHAFFQHAARHVHKPPPPPPTRQVRQARGGVLQGNPPSRHRERRAQRSLRLCLHLAFPHWNRKRARRGRGGDPRRCHHLLGDGKPSLDALLGRASSPPSSRVRCSSISRLETRSPSWPSA